MKHEREKIKGYLLHKITTKELYKTETMRNLFATAAKRLPHFESKNVERLVNMNYSDFLPVPNIRNKSENEKTVVDVNEGKDVKLICQVKENGVITSWLKNNKTISPSAHPRMRLKLNKYLKIKRVQKEDAGFYTCVAENNCGRNTYTLQLFVGSKLTLDTEES